MLGERWRILATVFLCAFAFLFSMQVAPPLIPAIIKDFSLSYAAASGVMLFIALPALVIAIPGGILADRYGKKRICLIGLGLVCLGNLLTAVAPSFAVLQAGRAVVGFGGALILSAAPPLIFQWFSGRELNLAMGIWAINMPLATVLSFNLVGRIETAYGWQVSFWIATILTALVIVVFSIVIKEKKATPVTFSLAALRRIPIWILAFIWGSFNMAVLSLTTWGKTLFIDFKGFSPVQADFLAGLVMLLAFTTPLTGYLAGRLGRRRLLILISLVGIVVCFTLLPLLGNVLAIVLLVMLGLFAALAPPCIFMLPPELVGQENAGLGFGVLNTALNLGVVLGPLIVGLVLDSTNSEAAVFFTMAAFAALGALFVYTLKVR